MGTESLRKLPTDLCETCLAICFALAGWCHFGVGRQSGSGLVRPQPAAPAVSGSRQRDDTAELDEMNAFNAQGVEWCGWRAMMHDFFDLLGIKAPVLVAGLSDGILRALSRHRYKLA